MTSSSKVSRRAFLEAGALAAVPIADSFAQASERDEQQWDQSADVVVVGSGAAGAAAALFAHRAGASVRLLEKGFVFGGTTAKSGGVFWIPNNSIMRQQGVVERREDVLRYLARTAYPTLFNPADAAAFGMPSGVHALHAAFYDHAAEAVDALMAMGLKAGIEKTFDGQAMPDYNAQLLENRDRRWRTMLTLPQGDLRTGAALVAQLRAMIEARRIPVSMSARVSRAIVSGQGRVVGVEATAEDGQSIAVRAKRGVVFATGGFTANERMCLDYLRGPILGGCAAPTNEGDLIAIAAPLGAKLGNMHSAWWWSVILEQALQSRIVPRGIGQIPGDSSILVNAEGVRCVNEKIQYSERTQAHFTWDPVKARYPNHIMFALYDHSCRERFAESPMAQALGGGLIPPPSVSPPYLLSAPTWASLVDLIAARLERIADRTGGCRLDDQFLSNLLRTVQRFNEFARTGVDLDFHRGDAPVELAFHGDPRGNTGPNVTLRALDAKGPFYCVMIAGGTLDTKGGPVIDPRARIVDYADRPIPGLYGAGNCIASPAGQAYWAGGATLGLALTFGAIAGHQAANDGRAALPLS